MEVIKSRVDDERVRLHVVATANEVLDQLRLASVTLAQQYGIKPTFDKAPIEAVNEKLGPVMTQVLLKEAVMQSLAPKALGEKGVSAIGYPQFSSDEIPDVGKEFTFEMTVVEKPKMVLTSYEPVEIAMAPIRVSDKELDMLLQEKLEKYKSPITDTSHEDVRKEDFIEMTLETSKDGQRIAGLSVKNRSYQTSVGLMPEGFDEGVVGMKVGEKKTFDYEGPSLDKAADGNEPPMETYASTVTVHRLLKEDVPVLTDEWVTHNIKGCKTVDDCLASVEAELIERKKEESRHYRNQLCSIELAKRLDGKISDAAYEAAMAEMQQELMLRLRCQGITRADFLKQQGIDEERLMMNMMLQARDRLSQQLAMDALARHMNFTVTDKDFDEFFSMIAPGKANVARESYKRSGRMFEAEEAARLLKTNDWLAENSTIHEA